MTGDALASLLGPRHAVVDMSGSVQLQQFKHCDGRRGGMCKAPYHHTALVWVSIKSWVS